MEISLKKDGTSGVVALRGPIGLKHIPRMKDYVGLLLENGVSSVYFDLSGIETMSVSAIGALCELRSKITEQQGQMFIFGLRHEVNSLVTLNDLCEYFEVHVGPIPRSWDGLDEDTLTPEQAAESAVDAGDNSAGTDTGTEADTDTDTDTGSDDHTRVPVEVPSGEPVAQEDTADDTMPRISLVETGSGESEAEQ